LALLVYFILLVLLLGTVAIGGGWIRFVLSFFLSQTFPYLFFPFQIAGVPR
jgi:hypothetical protein